MKTIIFPSIIKVSNCYTVITLIKSLTIINIRILLPLIVCLSDISQSSIDINKEFIDEASYNEASTDGASTDGAFIDTSIEAKEKKKIWKGKEQTIKRKKITQNRKKRNTTIKKIQNVQKKNKNKCDEGK